MNKSIKTDGEHVEKAPEPVVRAGVVSATHGLNVRSCPSIEADIVTVLLKDTKISIYDEIKDDDGLVWLLVRNDKGEYGYCMKEFVKERS